MPAAAQVSKEGDRTVVVTRAFDAPRPHVWRAFTEPALLKRWLIGPPGWEMHVCEMDVRTGGGYRWRWRHAEEGEFGFTGTYSEVVKQSLMKDRQVYDQGSHDVPMADATHNTVRFEDSGTGTRVISRMEFPTIEAMEQGLASGMTDGMEMSYANLDGLIEDGGA